MDLDWGKLSSKQKKMFVDEYVKFLKDVQVNPIKKIISNFARAVEKRFLKVEKYERSSISLKEAKKRIKDKLQLAMIDSFIKMNLTAIEDIKASDKFERSKKKYDPLKDQFLQNPTFEQGKKPFSIENELIKLYSKTLEILNNKMKHQRDLIENIKIEEGIESDKDLKNIFDKGIKDLIVITDQKQVLLDMAKGIGEMIGKKSASVIQRKGLLTSTIEKTIKKQKEVIESRKQKLRKLVNKVNAI